MTQEMQIRQNDPVPELAGTFGDLGSSGERPPNLFLKIHQILRGRYIWAILLGLGGMAAGGYLGYKQAQPVYGSSGMIHIKPVISPILKDTPETGIMPMYDSFVQAQGALIRSQRVIDMAMQSEDWRALKRNLTDELLLEFNRSLTVTANPRNETITLSFRDEEASATTAAVKATLEAYNRIYVETSIEAEKQKQRTLDEHRTMLSLQLKGKRDVIQQLAAGFGTDDLRAMHQVKMQGLNQLEEALAQAEFDLAAADPAGAAKVKEAAKDKEAGDGKKVVPAEKKPEEFAIADISIRDSRMWNLVAEKQRLHTDIELLLREKGDRHPRVLEVKAHMAAKEREIEDYAAAWRQMREAGLLQGPQAPALGPDKLQGVSVERLQARQTKFKEMVETAKTETVRIGKAMLEIEKLRREEEDLFHRLGQTDKRIEELNMESPIQGRVSIVSKGDRPQVLKDSRKQYAAMGGMAGFGLGVGLVLLLGLADRRMQSPEDVGVGRLALLGVLPSLPDDLADPEQAALAAHCVHQVRTLLQINSAGPGHRVFAITSPTSGTGKTSLTLGLGVSFAATGSRTLIVDCDILGGGLTARVDKIVRQKIGQILRSQGLLQPQQLEAALKLARSSQKRLGEVLVELGHLSEQEINSALSIQEHAPLGLLDVLAGADLEECIAETGITGLWILPLGAAAAADSGRISLAAVTRLAQEAGKRFDTVLIDTGPVPGSIEASVVAAAVDGVVLVVSRGEQRPLAAKCVQHLRDIGARMSGLVFNRADVRDVDGSSTTARANASANRRPASGPNGDSPASDAVEPNQSPRYGPVAFAVTGRNGGGNGTGGNGASGHGRDGNGAQ